MKKKISINIITTHDEPYLRQCLESVKDLDPEYIIGYTGDTSKEEYEICKEFADELDVFEWKDDFSYARNRLIKKSTSDWILWIDSDETIEKESIQRINDLLNSNLKNLYHSFKLIHGSTSMGQLRMFFNTENIKFEKKIHERIIPDVYPKNHPEIQVIHHVQNITRSSLRNIHILENELKENPNDLDNNFYIAIEYHLIGKHMKALLHAEKFLHHYLGDDINIRKLYMRYLISYIHVYHLQNYQKAMEIMLAQLILNCNIAEFWCLIGDIFTFIGKYKYAQRFYKNAISMGEYKYDNMWLVDLDKYDIYPKTMIKKCEIRKNIDVQKFNQEINEPIIP